ncbi:alpha/beta fold hydrolase [Ancylobacter defluvii]|uniref:Alpha/beta hydrolase n=1 Tax=Ancylobacter defluvii TaxID=1282440 RepID=A0A9W6JYN9_9HYPH|nr:alpha/beta hydrolase [Ancylobacter defluvii]MBS7588533.1 alpha/beta fold hydrolase [Ancylobacter defluvii]GLK83813.1 alpha/beta hydrolase [Ancylobacter defluvii]
MGTPSLHRRHTPDGTAYLRQGQGEPIVFVHGVGLNAEIWAPQFADLAVDHDVVAFDMLNHGGSARTSGPADTLALHIRQFDALLDHLGLESAHVVGHSMGALVSMSFAAAHPMRVRSLVALNAVWCRTPEQSEAVIRRADEIAAVGLADSFDIAIGRWFGSPVPEELAEAERTVRRHLSTVDAAGYGRSYALFARSDRALVETMPRLAPPALFMTGELDPNSTPAMSEAMAREAPHGEAQILPGERHMMAFVSPQRINERLRDFWVRTRDAHRRQALASGESC